VIHRGWLLRDAQFAVLTVGYVAVVRPSFPQRVIEGPSRYAEAAGDDGLGDTGVDVLTGLVDLFEAEAAGTSSVDAAGLGGLDPGRAGGRG
jgi:hypothetical protein